MAKNDTSYVSLEKRCKCSVAAAVVVAVAPQLSRELVLRRTVLTISPKVNRVSKVNQQPHRQMTRCRFNRLAFVKHILSLK